MTEAQIWDDIIPNNLVKKEFQAYQNMTPEYDSEKWRAKFGGSRKFPYYSVSRYVDGRSLIDPLLIADMKRVPDDYIQAVKDLAKIWLAEKKYVLGDRRADQVIITPDKRAWAFDFQFQNNVSRWRGTKDAYEIALKAVPQLHDLFMGLTGQKEEVSVKSLVDKLLKRFGKSVSTRRVPAEDLKIGMKVVGHSGYSKITSIKRLKHKESGELAGISIVTEDGRSWSLSPGFESLEIVD
jgi:hypothetical protein